MKIAYLDCFSGISGDMFLGALVDAGVPFSVLEDAVKALGVEAKLEQRRVNRSGIDAAKIDVMTLDGEIADQAHGEAAHEHMHTHVGSHTHDHEPDAAHMHSHEHTHSHSHEPVEAAHDHTHEAAHSHSHAHDETHQHSHDHEGQHAHPHVHGRSLSVIQEMIRNSALAPEVQQIALKAFLLLGHAEAKIHNVPVETIHFHEVGALDAIVDIVATAAGCHWLKVDQWFCSPLNVGGGHVHCAHGVFPVPAPATLELLRDLPVYASSIKKELVTPTGAALLRAVDVTSSTFPAMRMHSTGYGAGTRDLPGSPNVLRLVLGESTTTGVAANVTATVTHAVPAHGAAEITQNPHHHARVGVIETTIDDANPQLMAYVADRLLEAGASDVYRTPIQMKKGRAGTQLTVLCSPDRAPALQLLIFEQTTTLGLRYREETKHMLARDFVTVTTEWGEVRIKTGSLPGGEIVNYAPEFEDCKKAAQEHAVPLKQVTQAAISAYLACEPQA